MTAPTADTDLVARICADATAGSGTVLDVARDPLDNTVWMRMSSCSRASAALKALGAHGP